MIIKPMRIECRDNLEMMQELESASIDLIYCDILYGTGRKFTDYIDLKPNRKVIDDFYFPRIKEMHRLLKKTGSIYLQMDTRINHWVRCLLDDVFGYENFLNEISWVYRSQGFNRKKWSEKHDVILYYSKSDKWTFNLEEVREDEIGETTKKRWHKEIQNHGLIPTKKNGKTYWNSPYSPPRDWIDINTLPHAHKERNGYDTQKPKELVSKFIRASSNELDIVADFFLGSGTTAEVCKVLNRNFLGCDINPKAIRLTNERIKVE